MDSEIPCRDTDSLENANMAVRGDTLAFTIDFGDQDDNKEKAKRFERFAQRSSQRRVNSPRLDSSNNGCKETNMEIPKQSVDKQRAKERSNLSRASGARLDVNEQVSLKSEENQKTSHKEKEKQDVDEDVKSSTGTYTMDEEGDLEKVK
jgi:hypothetical protein